MQNVPKWLFVILVLGLSGGMPLSSIASDAKILIPSPDHPQAWYLDGDKIIQDLAWRAADQMVVAKVTYGIDMSSNGMDPTRSQTFSLRFPGVALDPASSFFIRGPGGQKIIVARPERSAFGQRMVLEKGVALDIHRRNGVIDACLAIKASPRLAPGSFDERGIKKR